MVSFQWIFIFTFINIFIIESKLDKISSKFATTKSLTKCSKILSNLKRGRGDLTSIFTKISSTIAVNPLSKLSLLFDEKVASNFSDKNSDSPYSPRIFSQKTVFNLWLNWCKKYKTISEEDFFNLFESFKEKKPWWNHYFDELGNKKPKDEEKCKLRHKLYSH